MKRKSLLGKDLEHELKDASQKYYSDGSSPLTDIEFDQKLERLKKINPSSEVITSIGHGYTTQLVSAKNKKHHPYCVVGSLDKVREWNQLSLHLQHKHVVCSLKLDGISCALYYTGGKLDYALTRGDGITGIDITDKLSIIASDMFEIEFNSKPFTGAIRGELVMSFENFKQFEQLHTTCKNPRNSVAGLINQKDAEASDLKFISLAIYSIMAADDASAYGLNDQCSIFEHLNKVHVTAPWCDCPDLHESSFYSYMEDCRDMFNEACNWPSDGIVIASNNIDFTDKDNVVEWVSQAYKFPSEQKIATVNAVEWNLSKTGYMIPKVKFNPIQLAGTTVEYASGFNAKYIQDNNIQPLCQITVTKSGEIIPYIVKVNVGMNIPVGLPNACPVCGQELQWDGVNLCCKNTQCEGQSLWDLIIWIKTLAPIEGLSDTLIEKFCTVLNIKTVEDLYDVSPNHVKNSLDAYHLQGKQSDLFVKAVTICQNGTFSISTAMQACNIPRFGEKTSNKCIGHKDVLVECALAGYVSPKNEIYLRDDIGQANCDSLIVNERKLQRLSFIENNLLDNEVLPSVSKGDVCITGKLSVKRKDLEAELLAAGYNVVSNVKMDTKFLITDDPNSGSSKNKSADKYGILKITEYEFRSNYLR